MRAEKCGLGKVPVGLRARAKLVYIPSFKFWFRSYVYLVSEA